jgi:hypothetical protein
MALVYETQNPSHRSMRGGSTSVRDAGVRRAKRASLERAPEGGEPLDSQHEGDGSEGGDRDDDRDDVVGPVWTITIDGTRGELFLLCGQAGSGGKVELQMRPSV